ncbi:MAG: hypothetical protein U0575_02490 [Phycisphaerales bacterium]
MAPAPKAPSIGPVPPALQETLQARDRASTLLRSLVAERTKLEARLAEFGRRDPIKAVTGRSAIENAIASTRAMVCAMDRLVRAQMLQRSARPVSAGLDRRR